MQSCVKGHYTLQPLFQSYPFFIAIDIANVQMRSIDSFQQFWLSLLTYAMTHLRCRITHFLLIQILTRRTDILHELLHCKSDYNMNYFMNSTSIIFVNRLSIRFNFICYHLVLSLLFTNPLYGVALEACIKKPLKCYSYNQYL